MNYKTYKFTIPHKLPGLNDVTDKNRSNKYAGAKQKKEIQYLISLYIPKIRITNSVRIDYLWIEENKRRDMDNIASAKKFIQDALVSVGVLQNDGWKNIIGFSDSFMVDKNNPRIEITITEYLNQSEELRGAAE